MLGATNLDARSGGDPMMLVLLPCMFEYLLVNIDAGSYCSQ